MKLLLPVVALASCQTGRTLTMPNGTTYTDRGHLAGNTLVAIKPDGTAVMYNKMSEPWRDFLQTAAAIYGAHELANIATAQIAKSKAVRLGSQRAATSRAATASAADLERLRLIQDFEKFRLTLPSQLPVTP